MNAIYATQIEWIKALNGHHIEWLNQFFIACNQIDTVVTYSFIAIFFWMGVKRLFGIDLLALALINGVVNHIVKNFYMMPRPYVVDPSAGLVEIGGYGFPSGAAELSILWAGALIYHYRKPMFWWIGIIYALFISFTRVYLGVHFITDILMGWFVGGVILTLYVLYRDKAYRHMLTLSPERRLCVIVFTIGAVASIFSMFQIWRYFFIFFGLAIGMFLDDKYSKPMLDPKSVGEGTLRVIASFTQLGLLLFLMVRFLSVDPHATVIPPVYQFLILFTGGLWVSFIMPRVNRWVSAKR